MDEAMKECIILSVRTDCYRSVLELVNIMTYTHTVHRQHPFPLFPLILKDQVCPPEALRF